jgi:prephenate dehydratase
MLNREIGKHTLIHKQSVAFLGPAGTYSYVATKEIMQNMMKGSTRQDATEYISVPSILDVFEKVNTGEVNLGVVPVENSIEGAVKDSMNLFLSNHVVVLKQYVLDIKHCLLSTASSIDEVKIIKAHPQALGQCKIWLSKNVPGAVLMPSPSNVTIQTAPHEAIIASKDTAELYGLQVLAEDISDITDNKTLFYLITQNTNNFFTKESLVTDVDLHIRENSNATILFLLQAPDKTGILRDVLGIFADEGLNVSRVHSLPTGELGKYFFIIDVGIQKEADRLQGVYSKLESVCSSVSVLGVV